jgi:pyridoxal phosphate enzyme (YggS family)
LSIKENLEIVKNNIQKTCEKSGRSMSDILLVGVTKTVDIARINELVSLGVRDLGENRVQELTDKYSHIDNAVNWHLIGTLQTNKVKYIIDKVKLIHSVDNERLLKEIDKRAGALGKKVDILVEINIAGEESKQGIKPEELEDFLEEAGNYPHIFVKGLMTVAPNVQKSEENRVYFKKMRRLFIDLSNKTIDNIDMRYLSMGMTNDYIVAIEEGASIVRIGTGIFGERHTVKL